jgi:hypothetical protein
MDEDKRLDEEQEGLGDPIQELRELEVEVSEGFIAGVLASLRRRSLVSNLATMIWTGGAQAFLEFLQIFFSLFNPGKTPEGGSD